jgi:hypothetical protein
MKTFWIIYLIIALLHGIWAIKMQKKYHPKSIERWRLFLAFVINSIGWPITIPLAIYFKHLW